MSAGSSRAALLHAPHPPINTGHWAMACAAAAAVGMAVLYAAFLPAHALHSTLKSHPQAPSMVPPAGRTTRLPPLSVTRPRSAQRAGVPSRPPLRLAASPGTARTATATATAVGAGPLLAALLGALAGMFVARRRCRLPKEQAAMALLTVSGAEEGDQARAEAPQEFKSSFLKVMSERGFLHQITDAAELDRRLAAGPVAAYLGFDATADSLHVGSLLQIMILRHLQRCGHRPVVLMGGGTSRIGDPSGKDAARQLLSDDTIAKNITGISSVFRRFLNFGDGPADAVLVNNADWLGDIKYLDFLRDYGPLFTINRMLTFDSVKQRLDRESPLTFLEFNYMLLQAYDFLELHRRVGVTVQLGGSDQWGNIINGVELGRKAAGAALFGVTAPLVTTADGRKMGKSAAGAVWLNADRLAPFDYWQFWRNTADADVVRFLKLFTDLPLDRIAELGRLEGAAINDAKRVLADEATALLHGSACLSDIHAAAAAQFGGAADSTEGLPKVVVPFAKVSGGIAVTELYVLCGFTKTKSEARRLIEGGGARLNDVPITDFTLALRPADFANGAAKLSSGKKKHVVVQVDGAAEGAAAPPPLESIAMFAHTGSAAAESSAPRGGGGPSTTPQGPLYITTPIYYVNDVPHIGHAYTTIAADCFARFARLDGAPAVWFVTGTDEHGQKVQAAAKQSGLPPQEYVDMRAARFQELVTAVGAAANDFIRTTEPRHTRAVTQLWNTLVAKGEIYLGSYSGWYCVRDEAFYAASELVDGKAPTGAEVQWVEEPSYFFRLSQWQDRLLQWLEADPDAVLPASRRNEVLQFVRGGLQDLSVSRTTFDWGVPVPNDPRHVMYVWVDALANYLTAVGYAQGPALPGGEGYADSPYFENLWPSAVHVVGKDILRFHAVYWPCLLMAAGLPPPRRIFAHGWWTKDGQKISKSLGNVIEPFGLLEQYGRDATRFFLAAEVAFGADGDFSEERFKVRVNSQLCNGLGNLCSRTLGLAYKHCARAVPVLDQPLTPADEALLAAARALPGLVRGHMGRQALNRAVEEIFAVCDAANKYVEAQAPWTLAKTDMGRMRVAVYTVLEVLRHLAILLTPVTPTLGGAILDALGVPPDAARRNVAALDPSRGPLTQGQPIPEPRPLVPRIP